MLLCSECMDLMEEINSEERCYYCFSTEITSERKVCPSCIQSPPVWSRMASALDYDGPAVSLITAMKYGNQPYIAKGAAALMASQFTKLDWPFPDIIIPVPIPFTRWMQRGYNQSWYLARYFGKLIDRPVYNVLRRRSGDYSQAGLSSEQRKELASDSFLLAKKGVLEDKTLLLIDDVMTTGTTLKCCAEVLLEGFPNNIYVMTACRSVF